ncbi:MAG: hypothetical protein LW875_03200 [Proteobacteria bacterium]|nr:hypothetical protein [Pseudomonadota bacterium]
MKKQLILGMATVLALTSFEVASAATRAAEVRTKLEREMRDALSKGSITGLNENSAAKARESAADKLVGVARIADANEMTSALGKTIKVKEADGREVSTSVMDIARKLLRTEQALNNLNQNEMGPEARAHVKLVETALQLGAQMIGSLSKTSDVVANLDAQSKLQVEAFYKQVSLLPEMVTKMDSKELKSHIEIMEATMAQKTGPNVKGDVAFAAAMRAKYGAKANDKMNELLGCAR